MWCIKCDKMESMEVLLQQNTIDINQKDRYDFTALQLACCLDKPKAIEKIAKHMYHMIRVCAAMKIKLPDSFMQNKQLYQVYHRISEKLNVKLGDTAIIMAVRNGNTQSFQAMLTFP